MRKTGRRTGAIGTASRVVVGFGLLPSPSPTTARDRYAKVQLPWDWHDYCIHWMSTIGPPKVRATPEEEHHVFD